MDKEELKLCEKLYLGVEPNPTQPFNRSPYDWFSIGFHEAWKNSRATEKPGNALHEVMVKAAEQEATESKVVESECVHGERLDGLCNACSDTYGYGKRLVANKEARG